MTAGAFSTRLQKAPQTYKFLPCWWESTFHHRPRVPCEFFALCWQATVAGDGGEQSKGRGLTKWLWVEDEELVDGVGCWWHESISTKVNNFSIHSILLSAFKKPLENAIRSFRLESLAISSSFTSNWFVKRLRPGCGFLNSTIFWNYSFLCTYKFLNTAFEKLINGLKAFVFRGELGQVCHSTWLEVCYQTKLKMKPLWTPCFTLKYDSECLYFCGYYA